jgi:hypothetical protein
LISTPTAAFASPEPVAGITDSGRAGISSTPSEPVNPQSFWGSTPLVINNVSSPSNEASQEPNPESAARDLGPFFYFDATLPEQPLSIAEAAAKNRAGASHGGRRITNADVERLKNGGITITNTDEIDSSQPIPEHKAETRKGLKKP